MNRHQRRAEATKHLAAARTGRIAGVTRVGLNALTEAQVEILNEHGPQARLLYLALVWKLRAAWEELDDADKAKAEQKPRIYSLGTSDTDDATWRYAEFTTAYALERAKAPLRKSGTGNFVSWVALDAPDGVAGHALTLDHATLDHADRVVRTIERHHWSEAHGWRIYDAKIETYPPRITWALRLAAVPAGESP